VTSTREAEAGSLRDDQSRLMFGEGFSFSGYERDPLYLNLGAEGFWEISGVSGIDSLSDGRAGVFADFDNDGDLDVFLTAIQGAAHLLFRNNIGHESRFLRVLLEGDGSRGRDAFGAVARVRTAAGTLTKVKTAGSGFLSQHDPRLLFGLGRQTEVDGIDVTWPGGRVERYEGPVLAGSTVLLRQGTGRLELLELPVTRLPDPLTRAEEVARGLRIAVGERLPELPLVNLDGSQATLGERLRPGRRLLVNVWATWCLPCLREMPELERLRPRLAAQGMDLVGLNVDTEPDADPAAFVKGTGVSYPILVGGAASVERLYVGDEVTVPLSILLAEDGTVLELIPGWSAESRQRFEALAAP